MAALVTAIDVSSHQPRDLSQIIATHRPMHVVVKLYLPEESVSQSHTRAQLQSARTAGCTVGGYVWCYKSLDPRKTVCDAIGLSRSSGVDLPVLWLDCETYKEGTVIKDPGPDAAWLREAIDECAILGVRPGIYTAGWWWRDYMGNTTEFNHLPLWVAQYDAKADCNIVTLFGGWTYASGKQWSSDPIDCNVFLPYCSDLSRPTVEELEVSNPNIRQQLAQWRMERRQNGQDPFDYHEFRRYLQAIEAPDCGDREFNGFCPAVLQSLREANPNIGEQLAKWQWERRQRGQDPFDYVLFRQYLRDIEAPDPGEEEFEEFRREI